jgi:hypothetical protein
MEFTLKKIEYSERMSEETSCYYAELYIDGVKVAYVKNEGTGGETCIRPYNVGYRDIIEKAEAYLREQPEKEQGFDGHKYMHRDSLEDVCDNLLYDWLKEKDVRKFRNKLLKDQEKNICIGIPDQEYSMYKMNTPFAKVFSTPSYRAAFIKNLRDLKRAGKIDGKRKILNTNIPQDIIDEALNGDT